jgi:hypothetical protein
MPPAVDAAVVGCHQVMMMTTTMTMTTMMAALAVASRRRRLPDARHHLQVLLLVMLSSGHLQASRSGAVPFWMTMTTSCRSLHATRRSLLCMLCTCPFCAPTGAGVAIIMRTAAAQRNATTRCFCQLKHAGSVV